MQNAEIIELHGAQLVKLPEGFRFSGNQVSIRKQGDTVVLEPLRPTTWPQGFFEEIHIEDPAFERPSQGEMPPAPDLS
jgi:virulence-associated protein VagC